MSILPAVVSIEDDKDKGTIELFTPLSLGSQDEPLRPPDNDGDGRDVEQALPPPLCEEEFTVLSKVAAAELEITVSAKDVAAEEEIVFSEKVEGLEEIAVSAKVEAADLECAKQVKVEPAPEAAQPPPLTEPQSDIENDDAATSASTACCNSVPWFCTWCLDVKESSLPSPPHMPHTLHDGVLPLDEWNAFWRDVMIFDRRKRRCDVMSFLAGIGTFVGLFLGLIMGDSALWAYAMLPAALLFLLFPLYYERRQDELFHSLCKEHQDRVFGTRGLSLTVAITRKITRKQERKEEKITKIISISQPGMGEDGSTPISTTFAYRSTIDTCCAINQWQTAEEEIVVTKVELPAAAEEAALPISQPNHQHGNDNTARRFCRFFARNPLALPHPPRLPGGIQGVLPVEEWNSFWTKLMTFTRRKRACDWVISLFVVALFVGILICSNSMPNIGFAFIPLVLACVCFNYFYYQGRQEERLYELCQKENQRIFDARGLSLTVSTQVDEQTRFTTISIVQPGSSEGEDGSAAAATAATSSSSTFTYTATIRCCCGYNVWIES